MFCSYYNNEIIQYSDYTIFSFFLPSQTTSDLLSESFHFCQLSFVSLLNSNASKTSSESFRGKRETNAKRSSSIFGKKRSSFWFHCIFQIKNHLKNRKKFEKIRKHWKKILKRFEKKKKMRGNFLNFHLSSQQKEDK